MKHFKFLLMILVMAYLLIGMVGCKSEKSTGGTSSDAVAIDFKLNDLDGNTVSLSDYKGKVVVLDFWATWCGPCLKEIPSFIKLHKEFKDNKNFALLAIVNDSGSASDIKEFLEERDIEYPVIMGNMDTVLKFSVPGFPTTFVVDKEGKIVKKIIGSHHDLFGVLAKEVRAIL